MVMPIIYNDGTVTHAGRVIEVYYADHRAMSDVYTWATFAVIVTDEGNVEKVLVNANFECDQSGGRAVVDATPDVLAIHQCFLAEIAEKTLRDIEERRRDADARLRDIPTKGKRMKVLKGRDHVGYEGTVAFVREGRVLLKPDASWQDRRTDGVWVRDINLCHR